MKHFFLTYFQVKLALFPTHISSSGKKFVPYLWLPFLVHEEIYFQARTQLVQENKKCQRSL
jgi:hypothetical protein